MTQMTLKAHEIRSIFEALAGLATDQATGVSRKWPVKMSYWIARMIVKLQGEYDSLEKQRIALAEQLGTKSEDGKLFEFTEGTAAQFNESMKAVNESDIEIDLPVIHIASFENVDIEPNLFIVLDKLIIDPQPA